MRMFGAGCLLLDNEKVVSHADGAGGDPVSLLLANDFTECEDSVGSLCLCQGGAVDSNMLFTLFI